MKTVLTAILSMLGLSSAAVAETPPKKVETVSVDSIRFTMPTVATDAVAFEMPNARSFEGAPQFHEDEWAQLEFFSKSRFGEMQKKLKELKAFEVNNRTQYGWNKIYARKISRQVIDELPQNISGELKGISRPAPILTTSSHPLGQVKNGFSIELGKNAYLYGLKSAERITVLGASLQGADDMLLANAFSILNKKYGLILVDWRQQFVLVSVGKNGEFEMWRP